MPENLQVPANLRAEQSVLGAILSNNRAIDLCLGLEPWHFYDAVNAELFAVVKEMILEGRVADPVTIGNPERFGGSAYLAGLLTALVAVDIVSDYSNVIIDCALRRQLIAIAADMNDRAYNVGGADTAAAVMTDIEEALADNSTKAPVRIGDAATLALQPTKEAKPLLTGLECLDSAWGGLSPGSLEIIGARPATGKTAFASQVARMLASQGHPVGFFSMEVTQRDMATANLASLSGLDVGKVRRLDLTSGEAHLMIRAQQMLGELDIRISDDSTLTLSGLISQIRAMRRRGAKVFIIDHRNKIKKDEKLDRLSKLDWYGHITDRLKDTAKQLGVSIVLLVQLRRDVEQREDRRPRVSDLEYAGEQDADNVLLLHRPELDGDRPPQQGRVSGEAYANQLSVWYQERAKLKGVCDAIFAKRRFGVPGIIRLRFDGPSLSFHPMDEEGAMHGADVGDGLL